MDAVCSHLDQVRDVSSSNTGCDECLERGGQWVHLCMCMTCGHVGRCTATSTTPGSK
ncbi:MAG TPA: hypothetical protein VHD87_02320 [Acidimicrobiales bacterium]|nr:hypothetical protein [Acidimicrobiales bacterium]